jgi:enamine deaminase RidA (YjgF/YER057c/UK114 family)
VHGPPVRSEDRLPQWKVIAPRVGVELVRSSRLASRAPCAYATVAHDVSRLVFTAGACPLHNSGAIVAVGDVVAQAERVMTTLHTALHAPGADLPDVPSALKTLAKRSHLRRGTWRHQPVGPGRADRRLTLVLRPAFTASAQPPNESTSADSRWMARKVEYGVAPLSRRARRTYYFNLVKSRPVDRRAVRCG